MFKNGNKMPTFKQKSVIKSFRARIENKYKCVSEETENLSLFLQSCLSQFKGRVDELLTIDDESFYQKYEKLNQDFENYREKIFLLQASIEVVAEDASDGSENSIDFILDEKVIDKSPHHIETACQFQSTVSQATDNEAKISKDLPKSYTCHFSCEDVNELSDHELKNDDKFQTSCETSSVNEDCFFSLQSDTNITTIQNELFQNPDLSDNVIGSANSFSQGSCYRSLSSNFSDICVPQVASTSNESIKVNCLDAHYVEEGKNKLNFLDRCLVQKDVGPKIAFPDIIVPSNISATLTHIVDPGEFWMQLENSYGFRLNFPVSDYENKSGPSHIEEGGYCLAPFKSMPFYSRAKALSRADSGKQSVKVYFIDHGSVQDTLLCNLRSLPWPAYDIPAQAIQCYLHGISPANGFWSTESTLKFEEFQNSCIETVVKCISGKKYGVQLIAKISAILSEDYSCDIAQSLCLDGLAIQNVENKETAQIIDCNSVELSTSSNMFSNKSDSLSTNVASYGDRISCDSGVSVTSTHRSSHQWQGSDLICDVGNGITFKQIQSSNTSEKEIDAACETEIPIASPSHSNHSSNLISFESCEKIECSVDEDTVIYPLTKRVQSSDSHFSLNLNVPPQTVSFVEKGMMLVMLSHIDSPNEFYVNLAMENIVTLDELREQMTSTYENFSTTVPSLQLEDIRENMFCAAFFDQDENWYRVKILSLNPEEQKQDEVFVHYIDYGNKATIKCSHLRPLTAEFAEHPTFAIKCSLAGVFPMKSQNDHLLDISQSTYWDEYAINTFKHLTSFERCLTAQVCDEIFDVNCEPLQVLLWDTEGTDDLLINSALADRNVAIFDNSTLKRAFVGRKINKEYAEINVLNHWDPMSEEYHDTENSYGVCTEDIQVATMGYSSKDEEYTCKYFSLRGHCPRGDYCPFMHESLLESGITRDQEEDYSLDTMPLIPENTVNILIEVSAIIHPGHFYAVLPFSGKDVDEIDSLIYRGSSPEEVMNKEIKCLFSAMNEYYSTAPFDENTALALPCGKIIAAKRNLDNRWHRARVIDVTDVTGPAKVYFVDFGDQQWVPRKLIRKILPQFLHTPFQAIECSLSDVEPIGFDKGLSWSSEAISCFKGIVSDSILLAHITFRCGKILHMMLQKTLKHNHQNIGKLLIKEGHAQLRTTTQLQKKESIFVPG